MRNLSFVQQFAALNTKESRTEMGDRGRFRAGHQADACEEEVICPKPRKMAFISYCAPELIKPMRQWQSSSQLPECEAGSEILEIFLNKNACGESPNLGCSPPYYFGSPPSRAGNPIVHDVQFHKSSPSAILAKPKAPSGPSFPASPSVRIEGFDCARQDSRCSVAAIA